MGTGLSALAGKTVAGNQGALPHLHAHRYDIDILVNNAGIGETGPIAEIPLDLVRNVFEVNVFGAWALTKACLPHLRASGEGIVINITSMAGRQAMPGLGAYAGSKFALEGMTEALRHEMRHAEVEQELVHRGIVRRQADRCVPLEAIL